MVDDYSNVLVRFINELKIPVSKQSVIEELEKHPDYGSIYAYSEQLSRWDVPNTAYRIPFEKLKEIGQPFIAFINKENFAMVQRIDENRVKFYTGGSFSKSIPVNEFRKIYSGAILLASREINSGESDYTRRRSLDLAIAFRLPFVIFLILALATVFSGVLYNYFKDLTISQIGLLSVKAFGVATAIMLLIQSINANNPLVKKLCGDDEKSCNAILNSSAAKVTSYLSWSEVGFFYFMGTLLALLFNYRSVGLFRELALLNLLSLPYTIYSIHYQWRVAKQWCVFCCTIQFTLWIEFFWFFFQIQPPFNLPSLSDIVPLIQGFSLTVLTWVLIKPSLLINQQISPLKEQLRKFKYNTSIFNKMVNDEVKYALPSEDDVIVLGNREAETVITIIVNPYCAPCAKAYKNLGWIERRPDVKLQIVYSTPNNDADRKNVVALNMMSIAERNDDAITRKALMDWYEITNKNFEKWSQLNPITVEETTSSKLRRQREWVKLTQSTQTPTLFVNGRKLPEYYDAEDLKYLV